MRSMFLRNHYVVSSSGIQTVPIAHCPSCDRMLDMDFRNLLPKCPDCGETFDFNEEGINYHNPKIWQPSLEVNYKEYVDWCLEQPSYVIKKLTNGEGKTMIFITTDERSMKMFIDLQQRNGVIRAEDSNESMLLKYLMTQRGGQPSWVEF